MARKSTKVPSKPVVDTTLAVSELRVRLEFLEQDNQKLIVKIEKKRTELNNLIDQIHEIATDIYQRCTPLHDQMLELDRKIHAAFAEILNGTKLGKQTRRKVEVIYKNLQETGLISPYYPEITGEKQPPESAKQSETNWQWAEHESRNSCTDDAPKIDRSELKKIRQIFLRLAEVFHPDKVTDQATRQYHTEVMQEINEAYQSGDLAKLLSIEKKHRIGEVIDRDNQDAVAKQCAKIELENEFLKSQFESLKLELKLTKSTPQGSMVAEHRKLARTGQDPVSQLIHETKIQIQAIEEIYQFVLNFRDRRIAIKDFIKGPNSFNQMSDEYEDYDEYYFY